MSYALYLAAPQFTREDEANERLSSTAEERQQAEYDLFGKNAIYSQETEELIESKLQALQRELQTIPKEMKAHYDEALRRGSEMTSHRDELLLFLRCEDFDVSAAARRLVLYWEYRVKAFGEERAYSRRVDLCHSLLDTEDDQRNLFMHSSRILQQQDCSGRNIMLSCPSRKTKDFRRESMMRVLWCKCHRAIRSARSPRNLEFVLLIWGRRAGLEQIVDQKYQSKGFFLLSNVFPVKLVAHHVYLERKIMNTIRPVVLHFLGKRMRQRTVFHEGSDDAVFAKLREFGIPPEVLPVDIGGTSKEDVGPCL